MVLFIFSVRPKECHRSCWPVEVKKCDVPKGGHLTGGSQWNVLFLLRHHGFQASLPCLDA